MRGHGRRWLQVDPLSWKASSGYSDLQIRDGASVSLSNENTPGHDQVSKKSQRLLALFLPLSASSNQRSCGTLSFRVKVQVGKPSAVHCERVSSLTSPFISLKTNFISKILGNSAVAFEALSGRLELHFFELSFRGPAAV